MLKINFGQGKIWLLLMLVLALTIPLGYSANDLPQHYSWKNTPLGGGGGTGSVVINPVNGNIIYAGGDAGGVYRTMDGAETWQALTKGLETDAAQDIRSIAIQPDNPNIVWIACGRLDYGAIYRSEDYGEHWGLVTDSLGLQFKDRSLQELIAFDPNKSGTIYIADHSTGVWKSKDGGQNWIKESDVIGDFSLQNKLITSLVAVSGDQGTIIYAAARAPAGGFFKSADGGVSWQRLATQVDDVNWAAIDKNNPQTIYLACNNYGIWKSGDRGTNWSAINNGIPFDVNTGARAINLSPDGKTLYCLVKKVVNGGANSSYLYKSVDGGNTWTNAISNVKQGIFAEGGWRGRANDHFTGSPVYLAVNRSDEAKMYVTTTMMLYKTADGGSTWYPKAKGLERTTVRDIQFDPQNNSVYLCTQDAGLFRSSNRGEEIDSRISNGYHTSDQLIIDSTTSPSTLYQAGFNYSGSGDGEVRKISGNGATKVSLLTGQSVYSIALAPGNNPVLYAGVSNYGIYRSSDSGNSWKLKNNGLPPVGPRGVKSINIKSADSKILYCIADEDKGIYKSIDGGDSWQRKSSGLPSGWGISVLVIDPDNPNILYAGISWQKGIYRTKNGGETWEQVLNNFNCRAIKIARNSWRIYAAGVRHYKFPDVNGGFYYSLSGDKDTWKLVPDSDQIPCFINSIQTDPGDPNRILLGLDEGGLWVGEPEKTHSLNASNNSLAPWSIPTPISRARALADR